MVRSRNNIFAFRALIFNDRCGLRANKSGEGVSPNFWRNLAFARHNTLSSCRLREKGGSAKWLAEPPFWRGVGGTWLILAWLILGSAIPVLPVLDPLDDVIKHRCQKDAEESDAEHAAEDGDAEGLAHFTTRPFGKNQGHHTEDEREAGHDDGPQPQLAGFQRGMESRHAGLAPRLGEFDDQDGVLAGQADQYHKAHLREDVDIELGHDDAGDREEQTHWHHENDSQGQRPALVLSGQNEED